MGSLVLHIGMTKTGSSALQNFLYANRRLLAESKIGFPLFTRQAAGPVAQINGCFVRRYASFVLHGEDPKAHIVDADQNWKALEECLATHDAVVLSDESLYAAPYWQCRGGLPMERYWSVLSDLLCKAGADDVTLIVYLRRQDGWLASWWRQKCKSGHTGESFSDFAAGPEARFCMDYAKALSLLEGAFAGRVRVLVRRYDRAAFEGGDIYHDFCAAAGIPWDEGYAVPKWDANSSITFDVAEALRTFEATAAPNAPLRKEVLLPLARKLSERHPDPPGTSPFDEDATRALMARYQEGNALLASKHFGGQPLFSEEYGGRPVWTPDERRIAKYRKRFERAMQSYDSNSLAYRAKRLFASLRAKAGR